MARLTRWKRRLQADLLIHPDIDAALSTTVIQDLGRREGQGQKWTPMRCPFRREAGDARGVLESKVPVPGNAIEGEPDISSGRRPRGCWPAVDPIASRV